jgi:HPt (histidine-containing phosphotransfer) domain-containing protein
MKESGMIDWTHVASLRDDMGDGFDELVAVFLEEMDAATAALDPAAAPDRMAADLHFLKGAALNLGFTALGGLCAAGEVEARQGAAVDVAQVRQSYQASRAEFLEGLGARSAA